MRLLATADLHLNHPRSQQSARDLVEEMNREPADVVLLVGDAGVADQDWIEQCLSLLTFAGPKLFVPGNHEFWTKRPLDFFQIETELAQRLRNLGWTWLPDSPFVAGDVAIVGSVGWYDYSFAEPSLGIPNAFYKAKVSPASVLMTEEPPELVEIARLLPPTSSHTTARWNDGRFIKLPIDDAALVNRECDRLRTQLESLRPMRSVLAAIHTVPFAELMPTRIGGQWDFARAYLGASRLGETIRVFDNVTHVVCGHSHTPAEQRIGAINGINIGAGYRLKRFVTLDL
jgi:predicted phosphohydrolase